jgi:hypothetical protein
MEATCDISELRFNNIIDMCVIDACERMRVA